MSGCGKPLRRDWPDDRCIGGRGQGLSHGSPVPGRIEHVCFSRAIGEGLQPVGGAGVFGEGIGGGGSHVAAEHLFY